MALLTLLFMILFQIIVIGAGLAWYYVDNDFSLDMSLVEDVSDVGGSLYFTGPGALIGVGGVATLLPALVLAALIVGDRPFSSYSSSRGGFNWDAFFKCLGVAVVIYGIVTVFQIIFFPDPNAAGTVAFTAIGFVLITVLVPFQSAAEEFVFRGFILQTFSSWTKLPVVGIVVSSLLFTFAHGYDWSGLLAIFVGAIIWGALAWYTKGIEVTCAAHIMNNLVSFYAVGIGTMTVSNEADIVSLIVAVVIDVVYAAAIVLLDKKFNWFTSKGDGTIKANEKYRAKMAAKQVGSPQS